MSRARRVGWWLLSVLAGAIVCLGILAGFSFGLLLLAAAGWIAVVVVLFAPGSTKFGMGIGVAAVFVVVAALHVGEVSQCPGERTFQRGNTTITEVTATETTSSCDSGPGPAPFLICAALALAATAAARSRYRRRDGGFEATPA